MVSSYTLYGDYIFCSYGTGHYIDAYVGSSLDIELPQSYDGEAYSIGTVFRGTKITSIEIPNSVTSIGDDAFSGCTSLTSIEIPNSVTSIGSYAFSGCTSLTSIEIPNSVTSIGDNAFQNCTRLASIEIPNSVTSIGSYAFDNTAWYNNQPDGVVYAGSVLYKYKGTMPANTSIVVKEGTVSIGVLAFYGCTALANVEIPNSVTSIGQCAFEMCANLKNVTISNGVTSIGNAAFRCCTALTSIELPNSVTSIGGEAFHLCSSLTSVDIPNSVTTIGRLAFRSCTSLTSVEIPNSVTVLESGVFAYCDNLASVIIPNSVTSIGVLSSWGEGPFEGCKSLREVEIPNSVTVIGDCAFNNCTALESVEIPSSVTSIGYCAFGNCTALKSVTSLVPADELFEAYAFDGLDFDACTLYVPYGAKAKYASTNDWKNFKNIVELRPEEITITINQYGSGTYCCEYALDFSNVDGLKAYAATGYNVNTGVITLTRLQTAREGVGLFLKGEPGEYTVPVLEATGDYSLNMLVGTLEKTAVNSISSDGVYANYKYTIQKGESTPMFYQFADGSSLSANKAYLQIPVAWTSKASKSISIRFDDGETTDIEEVEGDNGYVKGVYYDLQGRVVENPTNGIYIVDGKKVFINK